ncbi:biogenesis of lysosome-related organelles complex 1 subunit 6-like isoform X5 [Phymastichus coffea]|uniref:biogenesis of lysosome-related organelles complex 1 subunit 6-like isoform X5 n=1 Tax=Phymastichus coffea TaxID=108790 RepID=UPI00273BFDCE|nr:biogenesis of lysosome-related organelles complex 1 subunit 6-like isoform X5 [Phymastichus coffea]
MLSISEKEMEILCTLSHVRHRNSPLSLPTTTNQLTKGFLDVFEIPLKHLELEIHDLIFRQQRCIVETQQQNKKLCNIQEDIELHDLFSMLTTYYTKLMNIKQDVVTVHEKISKLKRRALRVQLAKQKEVFQTGKL